MAPSINSAIFTIGLAALGGCVERALSNDSTRTTGNGVGPVGFDPQPHNGTPTSCGYLSGLADGSFYDLFLYEYPIVDPSLPDQPFFRMTSKYGEPGAHLGDKISSLWLNLFPDHSYRAWYHELSCDPSQTSCGTNDPGLQSGGAWHVEAERLVLDGYGVGTRTLLHDFGASPCWPGISFVYDHDLITPGLKGQTDTLITGIAAGDSAGIF